jgi:hypothetical protein
MGRLKMPSSRRHAASMAARAVQLTLLLAIAGCGQPEQADAGPTQVDEPLPGPEQGGGAVTDMPDAPGPGEVPLAGSPPAPPPDAAIVDTAGLPPLEMNPEAGLSEPLAQPPPAPDGIAPAAGPGDPRDVLRSYYAAVNARDFAAAHAAWAEGSEGGGQSTTQFAAGFADTASIELTVGEPRPAEGAAGSVYVEVPVTVTTRRGDGSTQRQAGRYTLRRSQVDGASAAQRAWRIVAMDLRDAAG